MAEQNVNLILKQEEKHDEEEVVISFSTIFRKLKRYFAVWLMVSILVGGLIGGDSGSSDSAGGGSDYSAPVTPNTGDNGAVFAALGVLTAASCAAFVCLKKKKA